MPTCSSSRMSIAMCCSAERPRRSNMAWSGRTRCSRLSACTRASADCEPECNATPAWHGRSRRLGEVDDALVVQLVDHRSPGLELDEAGPAGVGGELVAVLVGLEADHPRLQPQREVLADHHDVAAVAAEAERDGEDAVVVGVGGQRLRQRREILVVELDAERAALVVHRHRLDERSVPVPQVLEQAERPPCRPPQLGMVPLPLQLGEHHERDHDLVFGEARHGQWIGQQHGRVDDVDGRGDQGTGDASPGRDARRGLSFTRPERAAHRAHRFVT